jgi:hypothetical protein
MLHHSSENCREVTKAIPLLNRVQNIFTVSDRTVHFKTVVSNGLHRTIRLNIGRTLLLYCAYGKYPSSKYIAYFTGIHHNCNQSCGAGEPVINCLPEPEP